MDDGEYNNCKQLRRGSSLYEQARSPREIISSICNDFSWSLLRDLILSIACFLFGVHGPKIFILPLIGGLTVRPIPYQVTAAGDVMLDLAFANDLIPKSDVTFPSVRTWFISFLLPISIVILIGSIFPMNITNLTNNNPLNNIHAGICTLLVAIGLSELVTQTIKFYVGRLRPNFYAMCGFDKESLECKNGEEMEMEARMSFPSGHSSLSFCGAICLVLFFVGRTGLGRPMVSSVKRKTLIVLSFAPLLVSSWCATSRLVDNWHHPSDIIAGSILGSIAACISYHLWFPHILSIHAGIPLSVISNAISAEDAQNLVSSNYLLADTSSSIPV
ncbi:hypothetical protein ACHAXH_001683 [Discostella pseudostelligera]